MSDPTERTRRLREEEDEEAGLPKEVGQGYPRFEFQPFGSAHNHHIVLVKVEGQLIGSLTKRFTLDPNRIDWFISFTGRRKLHTHLPVRTKEEGAQKLWQDYTGVMDLPIATPQHEPLPPVPDDENHYEALRKTAKNLVAVLSEDEESDGEKLPQPVKLLQEAGFKIVEKTGDTVRFSWPASDSGVYLSGVKRAREILDPFTLVGAKCKNNVAEMTVKLH